MLLKNLTENNRLNGRPTGVGVHLGQNYKMPNKLNFLTQGDYENASKVKNSSFPTGTQVPYTYLSPMGGSTVEMSASTTVNGTSSIVAGLTNGIGCASDLSGSGSLSATVSLLYQLFADLSGSSSVVANMSSALGLSADLSGSSSVSATIKLLQSMASALSGSSSISADMKQTISMASDIYVNSSTATVNEIVAAVWSALASDYNVSGTMGQKLNGAGSAGDPWTTDLTAYNTADTAGLILKKTLSTGKFIALK